MNSKSSSLHRNHNRGSVMIVALIFSVIIAISLTSYLKLSLNSTTIANRAFYLNAAQDLVDAGLEQALWSLNNKNWTTAAGFAAQAGPTGRYQGTFPDPAATAPANRFQFVGGVTGQVKVWIDTTHVEVDNTVTPPLSIVTPQMVSQATITFPNGTTIVKSAEAYCRPRSVFDSQMASETGIDMNGNNVLVDGYDSRSDTATTADDVRYFDNPTHTGSADDIVSISALSFIDAGNADVWGTASVGPGDPDNIDVNAQGRIGPYGTPANELDPESVSYDFTADFPEASAPTSVATSGAIAGSLSLPSGRAPNSTYVNDKGQTVLQYSIPSITLNGNGEILGIEPGCHVEITVTGDVSATGNNSSITLYDTPTVAAPTVLRPSTLKLYVAGNVNMTGSGIINGTLDSNGEPYANPSNFTLIGTRSDATAGTSNFQTFNIKGNGFLSAAVYAPNANITITGNGDVYGGLVGHSIALNGQGDFHGDVSLGRISLDDSWKLVKWRELVTASDRAPHAANLAF